TVERFFPAPVVTRFTHVSVKWNPSTARIGRLSRMVPSNAPPITPGTTVISKTESPNIRQRAISRPAQTSSAIPSAGNTNPIKRCPSLDLIHSFSNTTVNGNEIRFHKPLKIQAPIIADFADETIRPDAQS